MGCASASTMLKPVARLRNQERSIGTRLRKFTWRTNTKKRRQLGKDRPITQKSCKGNMSNRPPQCVRLSAGRLAWVNLVGSARSNATQDAPQRFRSETRVMRCMSLTWTRKVTSRKGLRRSQRASDSVALARAPCRTWMVLVPSTTMVKVLSIVWLHNQIERKTPRISELGSSDQLFLKLF